MSVGSQIQQVVNQNPAGTTFILAAGVHRMQAIVPRDGDQFIGQPGAVLSGSRLLTSFAREGAYWVASGQAQRGQVFGNCESGRPRCAFPEDLFFDSKPLQHVGALSQVAAGKWFFDYGARKIYFWDDPTGHTVEASVTRSAFSGAARNVVIRGLIIEKYSNPAQVGAIGDSNPGDAWTIQGNEIRWNHGVGIVASNRAIISDNQILNNGQMGILGRGDSLNVTNNELAFNNFAGYHINWEAGGAKFVKTSNLVVSNNRSHDNGGTGLLTSIDNIGTLYESNTVSNNSSGGIHHDLSYRAIIRNNIVEFNGSRNCGWLWGAQIQSLSSRDVEVSGNRVQVAATGCGNGIVLVQQRKGTGAYGTYSTLNNNVHGNKIAHLGNVGANGAVADYFTPSPFAAASNNRFDANTYQVLDPNGWRWAWNNSYRNWTGMRAQGQESTGNLGSIGETTPPPTPAPTASFTASAVSGTAPLTISFDASSCTNASSYSWKFGDGTSATGVTTSHVYAAGTFTATLTVTNSAGLSASTSRTITVTAAPLPTTNQPPVVTAGSAQSVMMPNSVTLNGNATDDGLPSGILTTNWSMATGPGAVTFGNPASKSTTASFSAPGTYLLRLTATDGAVTSYSDVTITVAGALATPTNLTAATAGSAQVNLAWSDNCRYEVNVVVERCQGAACTAFAQVAQLPANTTSFSNSGLTAGAVYKYRVRGVNGQFSSEYSNVAQAATQAATPAAPTALTASAVSPTQINVSWVDNASNEDRMLLEGCAGAGCSGFTQIAQLPANSAAYTAAGLTASTSYSYRARACAGTVCSAYSNIAQASTKSNTTTPDSTVPTGAIVLNPGANIQAAVNANPGGATFYLRAGMYRLQQVTPKNGNTFIGEPGAIMSGAALLSPQLEGGYWVVYNQTQQGQFNGECYSTAPRCTLPEDLYFDDQMLLHVAQLSDVGPGKWYFDYNADKIYMADNPTGRKVETSVSRRAFGGSASDVKIRGLIIEKYAVPAQMGAIGDQYPGPRWTIEDNEVRLNHGVGIITATGSIVRNNNVHHNGELGLGGVGDNMLIEGNEIAFNKVLGFLEAWEGGGTKWSRTRNLIVRNNYSHDNYGVGLWTDIDNIDTIYEDNRIMNNSGGGISHEISYRATIRNNILKGNAPASCSWLWGGAIQIQNSQDVEVYGNTLVIPATGCGNGITIMQQYRGNGAYGPYVSINNYVHNNSITHLGSKGASGGATDYNSPNIFDAGSNNRFNYNAYHVPNANQGAWAWANSLRSFASFKTYNQEANGSVDNNLIP